MKEEKTKIITVQCTFTIPVEVPDDPTYDMHFDIEENHCIATGRVGMAVDAHIKKHEGLHMCWACAVNGQCVII